jgi:predicted glycogen debranching enzyme
VQKGAPGELVLAADQFIIIPAGRIADTARAHAAGFEVRTVIAGYNWFTDWERDTMISLEASLVTRRYNEARWILHISQYLKDGLIPNLFPEGANEGGITQRTLHCSSFHAIDRHVETTGDRAPLRRILQS